MDWNDISLDWWIDDINLSTVYRMESITDWWDEELPRTFLLNTTPIQDQSKYKYTNWCTRAGWSHWINETNTTDNTNGNPLRTYAVEYMKANPKFWSSMSSFLGQAKRDWLITGYANTNKDNLYLIKQRIYNRQPYYSGSNKIDRVAMVKAKTNVAIIWSWPWHIFTFVGWDDNEGVLIARDSFGMLWGNWHFKVKYEDIHSMYTFITCTTPDEHKNLKEVQDFKIIEYMKFKEYTNGEELWMFATRWQTATILGRIRYWKLPEQELMNKMIIDKVWNWNRADDPITREEAFVMVSRFWGFSWDDVTHIENLVTKWISNGTRRKDIATREEIILLCGRMLQ